MFRTLFLSLSIPLFAVAFSAGATAADYLLNANFAGSTVPKSFDASGNATARVVDGAVRIDLDRYKDKTRERTELVPKQLPTTAFDSGKLARIGQEYWYGIRIFVPSTWQADNSYEVVTQWHGVNQGAAVALRMDCPGVSAGLHARKEIADRWLLMVNGKAHNLGYIAPSVGKWVDWVFRIRWSSSTSGRITVWRNKQWAADVSGATMKPDTYGPYWKFGIYKSPWKQKPALVPIQSHRTLFFDNVRIAQGANISSF
jgi:Polysaccharide lyase